MAGNGRDLLYRYALALALIPDPDAAGDLFMEARDERELRRLASAWRSRNGLGPAEADGPVLLPEPGGVGGPDLTEEQVEHAHHLARRGRLKRLTRRVLWGAAAALVVAGAVALGWPGREGDGLASDPTFRQSPAARSESGGDLSFVVYRTESTAGSVTAWWEVRGPGAAAAAGGLQPGLILSGSGADWLRPLRQETAAPRPDRLLGRSVYQVPVGDRDLAVLNPGRLGSSDAELLVRAPLVPVAAEPGTVSITSGAVVEANPFRFTLKSVTVTPTHTRVTYMADNPAEMWAWGRHFVEVEARGERNQPLRTLAPPTVEGGRIEVLLDLVPPGTRALQVRFFMDEVQRESLAWTLPQEGQLIDLVRVDGLVTAQISLDPNHFDRHSVSPMPDWYWMVERSEFVDERGHRYATRVVYQGEDVSKNRKLWRLHAEIDPRVEISKLQLRIARVARTVERNVTVPLGDLKR